MNQFYRGKLKSGKVLKKGLVLVGNVWNYWELLGKFWSQPFLRNNYRKTTIFFNHGIISYYYLFISSLLIISMHFLNRSKAIFWYLRRLITSFRSSRIEFSGKNLQISLENSWSSYLVNLPYHRCLHINTG